MKRNIGVFDSGVGGLTILKRLIDAFPKHDFRYVGDTLNVPYGTKSASEIREFVDAISRHLVETGAHSIVIACNTATINSDHLRLGIPIFGIIEPTAFEAAEATRNKRVIVLATDFTAQSQAYRKALKPYGITPIEVGCSPWVDIVEAGLAGTQTSMKTVLQHLEPHFDSSIDTVVIGCTHFGALKPEISAAFPAAKLVDGINEIIRRMRQALSEKTGEGRETKRCVCLQTTGDSAAFAKQADTFGFDKPTVEKISLRIKK